MHLGSQRPITFLGWIGFSIFVHFGLTCALLHPLPEKKAQCPLELGRCSIEATLKPRQSVPVPAEKLEELKEKLEEILTVEPLPLEEGMTEQKIEPLIEDTQDVEEKKNAEAQADLKPEEVVIETFVEAQPPEEIILDDAASFVESEAQAGVHAPKVEASLIKNPAPRYPEAARAAGQEGSVKLKVSIGKRGDVEAVEILKSSSFQLLDDRAIETVKKKWRFLPATQAGEAIASELVLVVHFCLT